MKSMKTANLVKSLREKEEMTQIELGNKTGYHSQLISNIERGVCLIPKNAIGNFAKHLKCSKEEIIKAMSVDRETLFRKAVN